MLTSSSGQPCKTTKWWVLREGFNNHGLGGNHLHHTGITILQELGFLLQLLTRPSINLGQKFSKLHCNVGGVAVQHRSISITDLSRVVHDDDLRGEVSSSFGRVILGVRGNITTLQILHSNILHIEPDIVTGKCLLKGFVVHFNRLNFSGKTRRSKCNNHTRLQDTSLHTTHRDSSNTTDLVHILKWKSEGLVRWPLGLVDHVKSLKESWSLVPVKDETSFTISSYLALEYLGVVASICRNQTANHLPHTKGESKQSMLTGLSVLGNTSLKTTSGGVNNEDSTVCLGINDSAVVLGGLKFPQGNINGDTTLTLSFELVKHPGILERPLVHLSSFFLKPLNNTLVNSSKLVDQVTSSGRLTRVDMANDHNVNVNLLLTHSILVSKTCNGKKKKETHFNG
nr:translation elongation factor 1-alpha [Ipomoea batatas]